MTARKARPPAASRHCNPTSALPVRGAPGLPGSPFPLGATVRDGGTNFAVEAAAADSMLVCLLDGNGAENQIPHGGCPMRGRHRQLGRSVDHDLPRPGTGRVSVARRRAGTPRRCVPGWIRASESAPFAPGHDELWRRPEGFQRKWARTVPSSRDDLMGGHADGRV
jgi:hypothetical protein